MSQQKSLNARPNPGPSLPGARPNVPPQGVVGLEVFDRIADALEALAAVHEARAVKDGLMTKDQVMYRIGDDEQD